ncbi:MAG: hypothetical protein GAK43_01787 [Stenotrophomonas maltophilia]|nr:MAG: hypothetical protein GAK43_01787 [Stenotrophomonas maltophilia]
MSSSRLSLRWLSRWPCSLRASSTRLASCSVRNCQSAGGGPTQSSTSASGWPSRQATRAPRVAAGTMYKVGQHKASSSAEWRSRSSSRVTLTAARISSSGSGMPSRSRCARRERAWKAKIRVCPASSLSTRAMAAIWKAEQKASSTSPTASGICVGDTCRRRCCRVLLRLRQCSLSCWLSVCQLRSEMSVPSSMHWPLGWIAAWKRQTSGISPRLRSSRSRRAPLRRPDSGTEPG